MKKQDEDPVLATAAIVDPAQRAKIEDDEQEIAVGQWYWVDQKEGPWFACVTRLGSNYVKFEDARGSYLRVHLDEFDGCTKREPDPDGVIAGKVAACKSAVAALMGEIKAVTASLAIAPSPALGGGAPVMETQALALRNQGGQDMKSYGTALEKAKSETLPDLFAKVKTKNEEMAMWMSAQVLPMKAQAEGLKGLVGKIQDRIFSVSLYAGLSEDVELIQDGEPAPLTTQIHLFQRRLYMDEECLAHYEAGGMEYKNLETFEAWLMRPDNFARTFPFPRCVVAFRVRHFDKDRRILNPIDIFRIAKEMEADKLTFLYIRNGGQLYRMATAIEFGENLFPDMERDSLTGKLWGTKDSRPTIITDNQRRGRLEEYNRELKAYKAKKAAYDASLKTPEAFAKAKERKLRHGPDASCTDLPWPGFGPSPPSEMVPFDRDTVYFDDMKAVIEASMKEHNRVALVLQGLLDRSPVFHPHPPWQIWTQAGFESAFVLIHDDTRGLATGAKPDFEAYRQRLNKTLKEGSITVGQQTTWLRVQADKEAERRRGDWRHRGEIYVQEFYQPYGNPGPGGLARLAEFTRTGRCTWSWLRERERSDEKVRTTFSCGSKHILNVDAYKPGDFRQFFADPRTRAEYLKWAPQLLAAEDYHAGKGKPVHEPVPAAKKKPSSWEGRERYRRQKETKELIGKAVRLSWEIETRGGVTYPEGSLWRVIRGSNLEFEVERINEDGLPTAVAYHKREHIRRMSKSALIVDPKIPAMMTEKEERAWVAAQEAKDAPEAEPESADDPGFMNDESEDAEDDVPEDDEGNDDDTDDE